MQHHYDMSTNKCLCFAVLHSTMQHGIFERCKFVVRYNYNIVSHIIYYIIFTQHLHCICFNQAVM